MIWVIRSAGSPTTPGCTLNASASWVPILSAGFSAADGSCGTYATRAPRARRRSPGLSRSRSTPSRQHLAGADPQAAAGVAEQGQGHRGLARAGLADQAEHLAGPDLEGHVADHLGAAAPGPDLEAGDLKADVTGRGLAGRARVTGRAVAGHAASRGPRSSSRAASSGRRSTPMATRAIASVYVFTPMVSRAISTAGAITAHGFTAR